MRLHTYVHRTWGLTSALAQRPMLPRCRMLTAVLIGHAVYVVAEPQQQHELCDERFLFRPLLAGRDVAIPARARGAAQTRVFSMAKSMQNIMYILGDRSTGECVAVDACYDPEGVVAAAESLGCNVTAAVGTHFHYDHVCLFLII